MIMDRLIEAVAKKQNPSVLGLDTRFDYLPEGFASPGDNAIADAAKAIFDYNRALIDGLADMIPAVKVQVAYYEMLGTAGMQAFDKTLRYAAGAGLVRHGRRQARRHRRDCGSIRCGLPIGRGPSRDRPRTLFPPTSSPSIPIWAPTPSSRSLKRAKRLARASSCW